MTPYGHKKCPEHGIIDDRLIKGCRYVVSGAVRDHRSVKKVARRDGKREVTAQLLEG